MTPVRLPPLQEDGAEHAVAGEPHELVSTVTGAELGLVPEAGVRFTQHI
ncbi:hypothetical protein ACFZB9_21265 [Kitasatospora sp. NPDC008050]